MQELHAALLALQEIDTEVSRAEARLQEFTPRLATLEAPVAALERELAATQVRLDELRAEQQRLERNAAQKRDQLEAYQDRLNRAHGTRDEAAFRTELDLVRRAIEADEADLRQVSEQATRTDLKLDDVLRALDKAQAQIAEERAQVVSARDETAAEVALLRDRRENEAIRLDPQSRRLYDRVRSGRSRTVLAPLLDGGACGNCFNVLPVQEQVEVRRGETLHRCEGCGVILYAQ